MPDTIKSYFLNHNNIIEGTPGHDLIIFMIHKGTNSNITNNVIQDMAPLSRIMVTRTDKPNDYDVWYMPRDWNSGNGPSTRLRNMDLWDTIHTDDGDFTIGDLLEGGNNARFFKQAKINAEVINKSKKRADAATALEDRIVLSIKDCTLDMNEKKDIAPLLKDMAKIRSTMNNKLPEEQENHFLAALATLKLAGVTDTDPVLGKVVQSIPNQTIFSKAPAPSKSK